MWEAIRLAFEVVEFIVTVAMGFLLNSMANRTRKFENLEAELASTKEQRFAKDETTRKEQSAMVEKLIDERIRHWSHEMANTVQSFMLTVAEMKKRLQDGEEDFEKLGDHDHRLEIKLTEKFEQLKQWMNDNFSNRQDLDKHETSTGRKFETLDQTILGMTREIATLGAKVKQ